MQSAVSPRQPRVPPPGATKGVNKFNPQSFSNALQVEVITPEDHMGDVIGDLNSRRGMVNKFEDKPGGMKLVQVRMRHIHNHQTIVTCQLRTLIWR